MSAYGLNNTNLFAYCQNNPVCCKDSGGAFANWAIGAIVGGLVGGFVSASQGGSFWAGAAQGAVSGAIAGAAVDLALATIATCGVAGVVVAGSIAFVGGSVGNVIGEEIGSLISTGQPKPVDSGMLTRSAIAGGFNVLSLGFSATLEYANSGIKAFNRSTSLSSILKDAGKRLSGFTVSALDCASFFSATHYTVYTTMVSALVRSAASPRANRSLTHKTSGPRCMVK